MRGRDGRLGVCVVVLGLLALTPSAGAATTSRDGKRNFPHTSWCPFAEGMGVEFPAESKTATVTFVACDNVNVPMVLNPCPCLDGSECNPESNTCADGSECSNPDPDPAHASAKLIPIDVRLDSIRVVRRDVFNDPTNRVNRAEGGTPPYPFAEDCAWDSVFDPSSTRAFSKGMPFLDDISAETESTWTLGNAEAKAFDVGQLNWQLVLANGETTPDPPSESTMQSCSVASVRIDNLVRGETYMLDFNWWVSANLETIGEGKVVMWLYVDPDPER